jgi:hypothetical protein
MKTKISNQLSILIAIGLFFVIPSCTIYEPQMVSIPLMSEKNEVQLNGGFSFLGGGYGSVAFAPAQHVALQVYGSIYPENTNFQGSVGYCTKNQSDLNFEIYGGLGSGIGSDYDDGITTYSNADYLLYFVQANFGQTNMGSAHIDYGFGLKTGLFDASVKDKIITSVEPYHTNGFLIEPQAFIRMGSKNIKGGIQINGTKIFLNSHTDLFSEFYVPFNFGLSINYRIAPSIRGK